MTPWPPPSGSPQPPQGPPQPAQPSPDPWSRPPQPVSPDGQAQPPQHPQHPQPQHPQHPQHPQPPAQPSQPAFQPAQPAQAAQPFQPAFQPAQPPHPPQPGPQPQPPVWQPPVPPAGPGQPAFQGQSAVPPPPGPSGQHGPSGQPGQPGPSASPVRQLGSSLLSRLTLRMRMALLVGLAVAAAVAVVAAVALGATRIVLNQAIDDQLVEQAKTSAANLTSSPLLVKAPRFGLEGQFLDANGQPLPTLNPPEDDFRIPVNADDAEVARGLRDHSLSTVTINGRQYRVATVPLNHPDIGGGALQLARPTSDVDRALRDLALVLFGVGVAGVVGAALAGRLVAHAALKPVDAAAAAAEEVARTQDLSALIPVTGSDEIARLATSLNSMLRALEASRLRQRQLVDDASHELRTPLTSLRTNIELLMRAEANPHRALPAADRQALLRDVDAQIRELSGLVNELVELSRDEAPAEEVERLDLAQVVRAAVERARRRANVKGIRIEVTTRPALVDGRPAMLERAVTNLLDNAVKFSPPESCVRVHCQDGEVTVADEGPGIAPEDRTRIFERFYRADTARALPGSGLGLAIVAEAVALHGGTVVAEEAPGGGALFRLRLPCVQSWDIDTDQPWIGEPWAGEPWPDDPRPDDTRPGPGPQAPYSPSAPPAPSGHSGPSGQAGSG